MRSMRMLIWSLLKERVFEEEKPGTKGGGGGGITALGPGTYSTLPPSRQACLISLETCLVSLEKFLISCECTVSINALPSGECTNGLVSCKRDKTSFSCDKVR